jgi:DNA primase
VISPETIALVRERTDIVALVQASVPTLRKRGRSWSGLCPFHKERTPSFHVNQDRGFFKCFGCGESGDVITFAMKELGYTFHEAVEALASARGSSSRKTPASERRSTAPASRRKTSMP